MVIAAAEWECSQQGVRQRTDLLDQRARRSVRPPTPAPRRGRSRSRWSPGAFRYQQACAGVVPSRRPPRPPRRRPDPRRRGPMVGAPRPHRRPGWSRCRTAPPSRRESAAPRGSIGGSTCRVVERASSRRCATRWWRSPPTTATSPRTVVLTPGVGRSLVRRALVPRHPARLPPRRWAATSWSSIRASGCVRSPVSNPSTWCCGSLPTPAPIRWSCDRSGSSGVAGLTQAARAGQRRPGQRPRLGPGRRTGPRAVPRRRLPVAVRGAAAAASRCRPRWCGDPDAARRRAGRPCCVRVVRDRGRARRRLPRQGGRRRRRARPAPRCAAPLRRPTQGAHGDHPGGQRRRHHRRPDRRCGSTSPRTARRRNRAARVARPMSSTPLVRSSPNAATPPRTSGSSATSG